MSHSSVEQFAIPLRGSREFGLDRAGIARLLMLAQAVDVVTLLPLGVLADRRGTPVVLDGVLVVFALPLGILRSVTPPAQVAWRTALYRVSVDGGMFAGPFLSGLLSARHVGVVPGVMVIGMVTLGVALLVRARLTAP